MSRSNPTLTNPATKFFSWAGSTGQLVWYDKEKQENVEVKLPFEFMVLDQLATITGYNKLEKSGFWSNEVRNTRKQELTVRSKSGIKYVGLYKNDQDVVQVPKGANYTQSIYIAYKEGSEWIIGNIKAAGSARSAWFDFTKTCNPENGKCFMDKGEVQTAQTGDFYPPVFTYDSINKEEFSIAITLDKALQVYLEQYLTQPQITEEEEAIVNGTPTVTTDALPDRTSRSNQQRRDERDEERDFKASVENQPYYDQEEPLPTFEG